MWNLQNITAENICSFREFSYDIEQGKTTLVFGENHDNDSQRSNGSGKSALIEAIAIGLTGEMLRKVSSVDEIINDAADNAHITLTLKNMELGHTLVIERSLSRTQPQRIATTLDGTEQVQSSVLEYNKWILDTIGLTRDEIFGTFILSKHKYQPFLDASDREKKEVINKFSNGSKVDESLEILRSDSSALRDKVNELMLNKAGQEGRLNAITEQIDNYIADTEARADKRKQKVLEYQAVISSLRVSIAEGTESIKDTEGNLTHLDKAYNALCELESKELNLQDAYCEVRKILTDCCGRHDAINNYAAMSEQHRTQIDNINKNISALKVEANVCEGDLQRAQEAFGEAEQLYKDAEEQSKAEVEKLTVEAAELKNKRAEFAEQSGKLSTAYWDAVSECDKIQARINGAVVCPECKHTFVLTTNEDVKELKQRAEEWSKRKQRYNDESKEVMESISNIDKGLDRLRDDARESKRLVEVKRNNFHNAEARKRQVQSKLSNIMLDIKNEQAAIQRIEREMDGLQGEMMNRAFGWIDMNTNLMERSIKNIQDRISTYNSTIKTHGEAINALLNVSEEDTLTAMEVSKEKYEAEVERLTEICDQQQKALDALVIQEARFSEFKTHLANRKVDALSQMTNEFLEAIGSDIRLSLSGFTILKSGKVREKISIRLLRNGEDCGSFGRFSEGEKARVNLANILALQRLSNANCQEGKGLNLLVLDEILYATDETGLASMFDALNKLGTTSLIVSHGLVSEGYPHKITVHKTNGISQIVNDSTDNETRQNAGTGA
jgi:DNA repair protein SbcC/Rad50